VALLLIDLVGVELMLVGSNVTLAGNSCISDLNHRLVAILAE
jgi:hypothetical protein